MKKAILLLSLFLLSGCDINVNLNPLPNSNQSAQNENKPNSDTNNEANNQNNKKSSISSLDDQWNLYTSNQFGFSLKVPKQVIKYGGNNSSYDPIEILEDQDTVYITTASDYNYQQILANIKNTKQSGVEKLSNNAITWAILVKKVSNENDIKQFIKDRYGANCNLEKITDTANGYQDVKVLSTAPDEPNSCWMNFAYNIFYNPQKNILVNWDAGQAIRFELSPADMDKIYNNQMKSADQQMAESFRFI